MNDPSLSCDLRDERDRRTTFDGRWHAFPDGVRFEDLRAALQAAWLTDVDFARELARRYSLYDLICLRCASALIAGVPASPAGSDWRVYQLCMNCWTRHLREQRSAPKKPLPSHSKTR